jgi:hypothetical protein
MTALETSIIDKIVSLPLSAWTFSSGPEQHFYTTDKTFIYEIFVSGGQAYKFQITKLELKTWAIAIEVEDRIREYSVKLMDELYKKEQQQRELVLYDINSSLANVINMMARRSY